MESNAAGDNKVILLFLWWVVQLQVQHSISLTSKLIYVDCVGQLQSRVLVDTFSCGLEHLHEVVMTPPLRLISFRRFQLSFSQSYERKERISVHVSMYIQRYINNKFYSIVIFSDFSIHYRNIKILKIIEEMKILNVINTILFFIIFIPRKVLGTSIDR